MRASLLTGLLTGLLAAAVVLAAGGPAAAVPEDPVVTTNAGRVVTVIADPGSKGRAVPGKPAGGGGGSQAPTVLDLEHGYITQGCIYTPAPDLDDPGPPPRSAFRRSCFGENTTTPPTVIYRQAGAPAPAQVTPAQLAQVARDQLVLKSPTVHRSPEETNDYKGDPFTWANLWTWFWTDPADYESLTQTVSLGPVSATVTAEPSGLVFDPGDGGDVVRCAGPGRAWTDEDGNEAPDSGCGYRYRGVTDGAVTTRLGIVWRVTWTGTGGAGGSLPETQMMTEAPLRVLQVQVVNR